MPLRDLETKEARQEAMRLRQEEPRRDPDLLTMSEVAELLHVGVSTAHRLLRLEPGVLRIARPGGAHPIIRVPRIVVDRLLRRCANP